MKLKVYSVLDTGSNTFSQPFFCESESIAKRQFLMSLAESPFFDEFKLVCLGDFDSGNTIPLVAYSEVKTVDIPDSLHGSFLDHLKTLKEKIGK